MRAPGREGQGGSRAAPVYSASLSSRVCPRLSVCLPGTDAAAGAGLGDGLGGRSCAPSASPRSIFKAASGLGRPPALPSPAPARPPRLPAAARRQPPGLRRRGGASGRAAPAGGLGKKRGGGGGVLARDPASLAWPGSSRAQNQLLRFSVSSGWPRFPHLGRNLKLRALPDPRLSVCYSAKLGACCWERKLLLGSQCQVTFSSSSLARGVPADLHLAFYSVTGGSV